MENTFDRSYPPYPRHHGFGVLRIAGLVVAGVTFAVLFALLFGWLVFLLWNWLMPALFGLKAITFWQAFGILLLAKLLFGGTGHYSGRHSWPHGRHRWWRHRDFNGDADWRINGSYRDWRYYDQYWKDEGKAAFEAYLAKIQNEKSGN
ncbi:MAG TPA: hypothetical protein VLX68_07110 [Chitinivibrionales bacterium]|nr:hypothetical protein [Chitinivibrionales bacterium]